MNIRWPLFFCPDSNGPALRVISRSNYVAKYATVLFLLNPYCSCIAALASSQRDVPNYIWHISCLSELNGRCRFSVSRLQLPSPSSRFGLASNGKKRHYFQALQRLSGLNGRLRFSIIATKRSPSFLHTLSESCIIN